MKTTKEEKMPTYLYPPLGIYISPLTDFGFKRMFSDKELLLNFLNEVLPDASITDVSYEPTEVIGEIAEDRRAVFDLLCKTSLDEYVLVEMQCARQYYFADRALFYGSHLVRKQAPKGAWDFNLKAVHVLAILDFELREGSEEIIERVALMNRRTLELFSDKLTFTYIQLPHFTKNLAQLENDFDRWLYILRYIHKLTDKPPEVQGRIFEKIFNMLQIKQLNKEEMAKYKSDYLQTCEAKSIIRYYTEKGIQLGEARGAKNTSFTIALDMAKEGEPVAKISKFTKLPVEELTDYFKKENVSVNT